LNFPHRTQGCCIDMRHFMEASSWLLCSCEWGCPCSELTLLDSAVNWTFQYSLYSLLCYNKVLIHHTSPCFNSKRYPQVTAQETQVEIGRHNTASASSGMTPGTHAWYFVVTHVTQPLVAGHRRRTSNTCGVKHRSMARDTNSRHHRLHILRRLQDNLDRWLVGIVEKCLSIFLKVYAWSVSYCGRGC
jgi:hypothetical protein